MRPTALEFASRVSEVTEYDFVELKGMMKPSAVTVERSPSIEDLRSALLATQDEISSGYAIYQNAASISDDIAGAIQQIHRERLALAYERRGCSQTIANLESELPMAQTAIEQLSGEIAKATAEYDALIARIHVCATTLDGFLQHPPNGDFIDEEGHRALPPNIAAVMEEGSHVRNEILILGEEISRKVKEREALEHEVPSVEAELPRIRARLSLLEAEIRGKEAEARRLGGELDKQELETHRLKAAIDEVVARSRNLHLKYLNELELLGAIPPLHQADTDVISRLWSHRGGEDQRKPPGGTARLPKMGERHGANQWERPAKPRAAVARGHSTQERRA
jgi:septal ring factor EnvC (AmiA/AmiB activator)